MNFLRKTPLRQLQSVSFNLSITINKAQGQTLDQVGVYLRKPVFTHGQFYVACSRVRSRQNLKVQVMESDRQGKVSDMVVTENIVFKEVL